MIQMIDTRHFWDARRISRIDPLSPVEAYRTPSGLLCKFCGLQIVFPFFYYRDDISKSNDLDQCVLLPLLAGESGIIEKDIQ